MPKSGDRSATPSAFELHLLGAAAITVVDTPTAVPAGAAQPRRLALLAVVAEAFPSPVARERAIGLLWPEQDIAGARRLLTQALYVLKRELGDDVIRATAHDLTFNPDALSTDLIRFRSALADGDVFRAVALYRGTFVEGLYIKGAAEFERWVDAVRVDTAQRLRSALEQRADADEAQGDWPAARRCRERVLSLFPFDSSALLGYVYAVTSAGDPSAARAAAAAWERRMRTELEVEPDPEVLARLAQRFVARPAAWTAAPVSADSSEAEPPAVPPAAPAAPPAAPAVPPPPPPAAPRRASTPRWRGGTLAVALVAGVVGLAAEAVRRSGTQPDVEPSRNAASRPRDVIIEPFVLRGDTVGARALATALADALVSGAQGSNGVRIVHRGVANQRNGESVAPDIVVTGSLDLATSQLRVDLDLNTTSPVHLSVTGSRDSVLVVADQLARELTAALYPELGERTRAAGLRGSVVPGTLRTYLDGEMLLRRGDFDGAWKAFRDATVLDARFAEAWYRRAIAAEYTQRTQDADSAIVEALKRATAITGRNRELFTGYARWRAGDGVRAEAIFRELATSDRFDRDAWFQLAEVLFHGAAVLGQSMDDATDAWRTVIALDSSNFEAIVHGFRTEARARNAPALRALLRQLERLGARGAVAGESRVLAAYGIGTTASIAAVQPLLDSLPDYSLFYLHSMLAGMMADPSAAAPLARRLTVASYPRTVQAQGHVALAHLAVARGRFTEAGRELDLAAPLDPVAAAWSRAYFATLPFATVSAERRHDAQQGLDNLAGLSTGSLPLSLELGVDVPAAPLITAYLHAQLALADGRATSPLRCDISALARVRALCPDLQLGLTTESGRRAGRRAPRVLEDFVPVVPYQFAGRSTYFSRTRERWQRADALVASGRDVLAATAFASIPLGARLDYVYLAPSLVRRGELAERAGRRADALGYYRQAVVLLADAEAELRPLRDLAAAGIGRLGGASERPAAITRP
ncbi:MAG: BTAD domain-containing putative transcriptional regulator [Gemmatimonadota bacterium]|nr:BTAD domain-containing putative transcriptional regulator [Gemmatimonadota bacterium]